MQSSTCQLARLGVHQLASLQGLEALSLAVELFVKLRLLDQALMRGVWLFLEDGF